MKYTLNEAMSPLLLLILSIGTLNYLHAADIKNTRCVNDRHTLVIAGFDPQGEKAIGTKVVFAFYRREVLGSGVFERKYDVPISDFVSDQYIFDLTKVIPATKEKTLFELELAFREYYPTGVRIRARDLIHSDELKSFGTGGLNGTGTYDCKINFKHD